MLRSLRRSLCATLLASLLVASATTPSRADGASAAPPPAAASAASPAQPTEPPAERPERTGKWPQRPHWDPAWSHSNAWDYTIGSVSATALLLEGIFLQTTQAPLRWEDPILFDLDARKLLRINDSTGHDVAQYLSWTLWGAQIALPVAVDVPYAWSRYGFGLARDLFWQDAVTLFLVGAIDFGLRDLAGRARPFVYECLANGGTNCVYGPEAVRSFPGGHFSNSTAASVLTCTQHLYVHLYGGPWDALTCAMTLASDITVGFLRIASDSHWASDEIVGGVAGALIGWGVPYIMHFMPKPTVDARPPAALVVPMPVTFAGGGGLGVGGIF